MARIKEGNLTGVTVEQMVTALRITKAAQSLFSPGKHGDGNNESNDGEGAATELSVVIPSDVAIAGDFGDNVEEPSTGFSSNSLSADDWAECNSLSAPTSPRSLADHHTGPALADADVGVDMGVGDGGRGGFGDGGGVNNGTAPPPVATHTITSENGDAQNTATSACIASYVEPHCTEIFQSGRQAGLAISISAATQRGSRRSAGEASAARTMGQPADEGRGGV